MCLAVLDQQHHRVGLGHPVARLEVRHRKAERIGQGRENAKQFLREHPDVARKIELKVLAHQASSGTSAGRRSRAGGPGAGAGASGSNIGGTSVPLAGIPN
jgi:hypothetical protein